MELYLFSRTKISWNKASFTLAPTVVVQGLYPALLESQTPGFIASLFPLRWTRADVDIRFRRTDRRQHRIPVLLYHTNKDKIGTKCCYFLPLLQNISKNLFRGPFSLTRFPQTVIIRQNGKNFHISERYHFRGNPILIPTLNSRSARIPSGSEEGCDCAGMRIQTQPGSGARAVSHLTYVISALFLVKFFLIV